MLDSVRDFVATARNGLQEVVDIVLTPARRHKRAASDAGLRADHAPPTPDDPAVDCAATAPRPSFDRASPFDRTAPFDGARTPTTLDGPFGSGGSSSNPFGRVPPALDRDASASFGRVPSFDRFGSGGRAPSFDRGAGTRPAKRARASAPQILRGEARARPLVDALARSALPPDLVYGGTPRGAWGGARTPRRRGATALDASVRRRSARRYRERSESRRLSFGVRERTVPPVPLFEAREDEMEKERAVEQKALQGEARGMVRRVDELEKMAAPPRDVEFVSEWAPKPGLAVALGTLDNEIPGMAAVMSNPLFREKMEKANVNVVELATYGKRRKERSERLAREKERLANMRAASVQRTRALEREFDVDAHIAKVYAATGRGGVDEPGPDDSYEFNYEEDEDPDWDEADCAPEETKEKGVTVADEASAFGPLTGTALKRLRRVMSTRTDKELCTAGGVPIRSRDVRLLQPNVWLNDEVVNGYMGLLKERSDRFAADAGGGKPRPRVQVVMSFFYGKLVEANPRTREAVYDYTRVRRWTRKYDVFSFDYLFVPINHGNLHWALGVVNFRDKKVEYYDSMGSTNPDVLGNLMRWVGDEMQHKKGEVFDPTDWSSVAHGRDVPQQCNSDDCGVFLLKYADFLARGAQLNFKAVHANYFRARLAHELIVGRVA